MERNLFGSSGNDHGKGRSNGNRNESRSSRRSSSKIETRTKKGYKQFRDQSMGAWVYTHRRVMENKFDGDVFKRDHRELLGLESGLLELEQELVRRWYRSQASDIINELDNLEDRRDYVENAYRCNRREWH